MESRRVISTQNSKFIANLKNPDFINSINAGQIQKMNSKYFASNALKVNAHDEFYTASKKPLVGSEEPLSINKLKQIHTSYKFCCLK